MPRLLVVCLLLCLSLPLHAQETTEEPLPPTATPTATPEPTQTPLIQTVEVVATVDVLATVLVPQEVPVIPPVYQIPPVTLPTPILTATPAFGWTRHESLEFIPMIGVWRLVRDRQASGGAYHETTAAGATQRFPFTGEGLRVIYRAHPQGGRFALVLDGEALAVFDTHADEAHFALAGPFFFTPGYHVVDVVALIDRPGERAVGIDALDVFQGPPLPARTPTPAPVLQQPVAGIDLISQPAPARPTTTPIPPALVTVEVVVAYDLNRNRTADPHEGVQGLPVRLLDGVDNQLLASALTDERGYARLQALTANPVTATVPYLGERFPVRPARGQAQSVRWTLILPAGNQPGLIP